MPELEKRIGLLRLLLADIVGKQEQLTEMEAQYRTQLARIVEFVVFREGDVGNALSLMSEVQGKLDEVTQTSVHLKLIAHKATTELEVLLLTKRVSEARSQLARLQERHEELSERLSRFSEPQASVQQASLQGDEAEREEIEELRAIHLEVEREIARLNDLITDASERAARTVQQSDRQK